jgi:hypothetical protein
MHLEGLEHYQRTITTDSGLEKVWDKLLYGQVDRAEPEEEGFERRHPK